MLKILDKALILPLMPHRVAEKFILCMILRKTRYVNRKKYQASRSLSAIAELLVFSTLVGKLVTDKSPIR